MRLQERRSAETRHLLYETAMSLFFQDGYEHTSVDRIVAAAGVAKGTFFRHYATKATVLQEWIHTWFEEVVQEAAVDETVPLLDKLLSLARAMARRGRPQLRLTGWLIVEHHTAMLRTPELEQEERAPEGIETAREPGVLIAYIAELIRTADFRTHEAHPLPVAAGGYVGPYRAAEALNNAWFGTILFCLENPDRSVEAELTRAARIWHDGIRGALRASEQEKDGEE